LRKTNVIEKQQAVLKKREIYIFGLPGVFKGEYVEDCILKYLPKVGLRMDAFLRKEGNFTRKLSSIHKNRGQK